MNYTEQELEISNREIEGIDIDNNKELYESYKLPRRETNFHQKQRKIHKKSQKV